jgi:hypothetical protein
VIPGHEFVGRVSNSTTRLATLPSEPQKGLLSDERPGAPHASPEVVVRLANPTRRKFAAALVREAYAAFAADLGAAWPRYRDAIDAALAAHTQTMSSASLRR